MNVDKCGINRKHIFFMLAISQLSHVYLAQYGQYFPRFSYFAFNKSAKYEKLGKYWPYCTRNQATTNANQSCVNLFSYNIRNIFSLPILFLLSLFYTGKINYLTFEIDTTLCDIKLAFDCFVLSFSWVTLYNHTQGVEVCVMFSYDTI